MSAELATYIIVTGVVIGGLYVIGHNLIDAYFRRKEKFVETLNNKLRGSSNGTSE